MTFLHHFLIFSLSIYNFSCNYFGQNNLFYQAPFLDVNFTNITIGMSVPLSKSRSSFYYQSYAGGIIAAICQADQLNQNLYRPINFSGTINLAIQDHSSDDKVGQYAMFELLKNDLYNRTTRRSLSDYNIDNLAGFIGLTSSGINRINVGISAGFAIPFLNPGTLDQVDPADNFAIFSSVENRTMFSIRDTIIYSNIDVLVNLMEAYNWTIAANIYENNVLGQIGQQSIQLYQSKHSMPIFTCNSILTKITDTNFFIEFCDCVTGIDTLTVISLFTSALVGFEIILQVKKYCKAAKKFVFVVTGESQPLPEKLYRNEVDFKSTFIIRPFGTWNFTSFVDNCIATGTPQARKAIEIVLKDLLLDSFNCYKYSEETKNLAPCNNYIFNRPVPCICTGLELDPKENPYGSQNFFFADAVSTYVSVLALLQQNCTLINDLLDEKFYKIAGKLDFCNLEKITPAILTGLITQTKFVGYTGLINFYSDLLSVRAVKAFYLYNVHTTIENAVLVGNFSIDGYYVDYANIVLPDGNKTVSALVPQNPDLEYAAIAVFFGILIGLMVMTILAFIITVVLRNHIIIRRNTPFISLLVLIGLLFVEFSAIISCFGAYDWSCTMYIITFNFGMSLILSGIIAKEYRIYRIFSNKTATAVKFKDYHLLPFNFGITAYFTLIAIFMIICGFDAETKQSSSNQFYIYVRCSFSSSFWALFYIILLDVSFFICRAFAVYLAWRTRKVTSSYSESKSVFAVVAIYLCLDLIFVPLIQSLADGTDSAIIRLCIRLINVSITAAATLSLMYYYRFWLVYAHEQRKKERATYISRFSNLSIES